MTILKQIALSTILAGMFLSAGAFAQPRPVTASTNQSFHVTVIHKTSTFPHIVRRASCDTAQCGEA